MGWVFFLPFLSSFLPSFPLVLIFYLSLTRMEQLGKTALVEWWLVGENWNVHRKTCPSAIAVCIEVWYSHMFQWFNIISHWISATQVKLCEIWGFHHGVGEGIAVLSVTPHNIEGSSLDLNTCPAVELLCLECTTHVVLLFLLSSKF